jgi:hypothetical protein
VSPNLFFLFRDDCGLGRDETIDLDTMIIPGQEQSGPDVYGAQHNDITLGRSRVALMDMGLNTMIIPGQKQSGPEVL